MRDHGVNTPADESVHEVAVIGTGMIGTSIALALRAKGILTYLCDRDPNAAAMAAARRAGVVGLPAAPVDIAVLAVPPSDIAAVLAECQAKSLAHFYTDVGSVKVAPTAEAEVIGCDLTNYVGGHPMVGSERSGPLAASADLFRARAWALTPLPNASPAAIDAVVELVGLTGAHAVMMTPSEHDRAIARISHVPYLVACALAASVQGADDAVSRLRGAGIREAARVAAGDTALWRDILRANATEVSKVLSEIATELTTVAASMCSDSAELIELLNRGNAGRAFLTAEPSDAIARRQLGRSAGKSSAARGMPADSRQ
ncbi:prephenate dehydrogenase [Nocardia sp. CA-135398]|uniref:prephenate dehydrogenase n=1 Tax=Nocardia sp. CA-135398 TaxID=3239977 RepID=UPI003D994DD6